MGVQAVTDESWRISRDKAIQQRDEARLWVERLQEEVRQLEAQLRERDELIRDVVERRKPFYTLVDFVDALSTPEAEPE
jgi:uncharacterized coiled-coil DUF342 family protein